MSEKEGVPPCLFKRFRERCVTSESDLTLNYFLKINFARLSLVIVFVTPMTPTTPMMSMMPMRSMIVMMPMIVFLVLFWF